MKVLPILLLLLMVLPLVPAVSASDWSYSSTTSFASYFHVWAISGSVSSATPTLTFDTAKEYYEFTLTLTPASSNCTIEFTVSDCYMGCDLYVSSVLKTGDSAYTLSVPYAYNSTDVPAKDWGSGTLASPTGNMGIYKRVMLYQNGVNPVTVVFRVYYATAPAVGFDGVNDYVKINDDSSLSPVTTGYLQILLSVKAIDVADLFLVKMATDNNEYRIKRASSTGAFEAYLYQGNASFYMTESGAVMSLLVCYNLGVMIDTISPVLNLTIDHTHFDTSTSATGAMIDGTANLFLMKNVYSDYQGGIVYNLTLTSDNNFLSPTTSVLIFNASSFSGGASTAVNDFSASENDGVVYGNCQYKVYAGTGFQFTIPGSVFLTIEWGSYPPAGTSSPAVGSTTELVWGGSQTLYAYPMSNYEFDNFEVNGVEYTNGTALVLYTNCTAYLNLESVDNVALAGFYTEILSFWVPFVAFAILSFWSIRMRGNYKYFGLVFPILGLTWAFAETSYPSALFYYVSATFFVFMLLFVGFKLAGLGGRNQKKWG